MLSYLKAVSNYKYDPDTGQFYWRVDRGYRIKAGDKTGSKNGRGYVQLNVDGKHYYAHRVAWLIMTGEWPNEVIDHINGDPSDNRWENLRSATHAQAHQNIKVYKSNSTGLVGAYKADGRWVSMISVNGKRLHLGSFNTIEEAARAYINAAKKFHGGFNNLHFEDQATP